MNDRNDPFNFQRFVDAQNLCFESVRSELRSGKKSGHWMWFIKGLGQSFLAQKFAIWGHRRIFPKEHAKGAAIGQRGAHLKKVFAVTRTAMQIAAVWQLRQRLTDIAEGERQ